MAWPEMLTAAGVCAAVKEIRAAPLTNSWFRVGDGAKRPPANVSRARGWRFRRDATLNGKTRKCRKYDQLRSYGC
jgi:hypothetical protein